MQHIEDLINTAFINPEGVVNKMFTEYKDYVNKYGFAIQKEVIGCEYVKILLKMQQIEKDKDYDYFNKTSKHRLENWINANYKDNNYCLEFDKHKRIRG